jgi:hypothetical protein
MGKTAMRIPRFHSLGENDGHFYAVAYVLGSYVPPPGRSEGEALYVLNFSPSKNFTRFSFETVSPEGHLFSYTRGLDDLNTAEYALLCAWREERIPLHAWWLFPSSSIDEAAFNGDAKARSDYEAARCRVALMLDHARAHVWIKAKFPTEPMFRFSEADFPQPMADTPEYREISKYVTDRAAQLPSG